MLSRSPEKIIALGALLLMSPRLGLRNGVGRFGAGLPPQPRLYPLVQRDTGTAGYPRPLGSPARGACFAVWYLCTGGNWRQNHAWGCYEIKHGFFFFFFYKFQANNRTPQCASITNTVLCIQRSCNYIYLLWTNHYFRHYKISKINLFVYMGGNNFYFWLVIYAITYSARV